MRRLMEAVAILGFVAMFSAVVWRVAAPKSVAAKTGGVVTVRGLKIWIPRQEAERIVGKPLKETVAEKPWPEYHTCDYPWGSVVYVDGLTWIVVGAKSS